VLEHRIHVQAKGWHQVDVAQIIAGLGNIGGEHMVSGNKRMYVKYDFKIVILASMQYSLVHNQDGGSPVAFGNQILEELCITSGYVHILDDMQIILGQLNAQRGGQAQNPLIEG